MAVELRSKLPEPPQLNVLLVAHLEQERFHPREPLADGSHQGRYLRMSGVLLREHDGEF
jgi:hypothetical protein